MQELMIDFETLATTPNAAVLSLGACFFDLENDRIGATFEMVFSIQEQFDAGRKVEADTLKWWMQQSGAAKKVFHEQAKTPEFILKTFSKWVTDNCLMSKVKPWGNGATFDITLIENLFRQYGVKCPWTYDSIMDVRTFRRFVAGGAKIPVAQGTHHNALDDAKNQATFVIEQHKFYKEMLQTYANIAKGNK